MDNLPAHASPFIGDLLAMLAIMVGSVLLIAALILPRQQFPSEPLASMRDQTIPPPYEAKKTSH